MTAIEQVLSHFEKPKANGNGWKASCPAHDDRVPSLSINEGDDGRVLLKCHAGCNTDAVVKAMGLTMADLMPDNGSVQNPKSVRPGRLQKSFNTLDEAVAQARKNCRPPEGAALTSHEYTNREGDTVAVACRWDQGGEK